LESACSHGNEAVVRFMLEHPAAPATGAAVAKAVKCAASAGQVRCLQILMSHLVVCDAERAEREQILGRGIQSAQCWCQDEEGANVLLDLLRQQIQPLSGSLVRSIVHGLKKVLHQPLQVVPDGSNSYLAQLVPRIWGLLWSQEHGTEAEQAMHTHALRIGIHTQVEACCHGGNLPELTLLLDLSKGAASQRGAGGASQRGAGGAAWSLELGAALNTALKNSQWQKRDAAQGAAGWRRALQVMVAHTGAGTTALLALRPQLSGGSRTLHRHALAAMHGEDACAALLSSAQKGVLKPHLVHRLPLEAPLREHCSSLRHVCWVGDEDALCVALGLLFVGSPLAVLPWGKKGLHAHILLDDAVRGGLQGGHARSKAAAAGIVHPSVVRQRMLRLLFGLCGSFAAPFSTARGQEVLLVEWRAARWGGSAIRHGRRSTVLSRYAAKLASGRK